MTWLVQDTPWAFTGSVTPAAPPRATMFHLILCGFHGSDSQGKQTVHSGWDTSRRACFQEWGTEGGAPRSHGNSAETWGSTRAAAPKPWESEKGQQLESGMRGSCREEPWKTTVAGETLPAEVTSTGGSQGRDALTPLSPLPPISHWGLPLTKPNREPEAGTLLVWPIWGSSFQGHRGDRRGQ